MQVDAILIHLDGRLADVTVPAEIVSDDRVWLDLIGGPADLVDLGWATLVVNAHGLDQGLERNDPASRLLSAAKHEPMNVAGPAVFAGLCMDDGVVTPVDADDRHRLTESMSATL